jgi:hypothetical protein
VVATLIDPPAYFADSTNSVLVAPGSKHSYEYVLGILNSTLTQWRFKLTSTNNNVGTNELQTLPLRLIDFDDPAEVALHSRMEGLVIDIIAAMDEEQTSNERDREMSLRKIAALNRQIDALVYELYGIDAVGIAIIEQSLPRPASNAQTVDGDAVVLA